MQKQQQISMPADKASRYLICALATAFYIVPIYFTGSGYSFGDNLFDILNYASLAIMGLYIVLHLIKPTAREYWIALYLVILLTSTLINDGSFIEFLKNAVRIIFPCLVLEELSKSEVDMLILFKAMRDMTLFFFIMNVVITFIMPGGIPGFSKGEAYFLYGNSNATMRSVYLGLWSSCALDVKEGRFSKKTIIFFVGIFYLSVNVYIMATALISTVFLISWLAFSSFFSRNIRIVLVIILAILLIFEFGVVILHNQSTLLSVLLEKLGKDETLSGRYPIWDSTMYYIKHKPMLGYGMISGGELKEMCGNPSGSHNFYFDTVLSCGFVGLVVLMLFFIYPFIQIFKVKKITFEIYILAGFCLALLMMFLSEPFRSYEKMFIPMFCLLNIMMSREIKLRKGAAL